MPGVFGFHEVFHLCTLVAALCHYVAIWLASSPADAHPSPFASGIGWRLFSLAV